VVTSRAATGAESTDAALQFSRHSEPVEHIALAELARLSKPARIRVFEPYEEREVEFDALPFAPLLDAIYGTNWRSEEELLFTCSDGYQPTVPVQRALMHDAWLAFARVDQPDFSIRKLESGSRKRVDLSPFYLVWDNLKNDSLRLDGDYGWPYQLVGIDLVRTRDRFPRTAPPDDATPEAVAGYAAFRIHCSRCHAINGQGGSIGPELKTLAIRDADWLRRWIDDPSALLATARMPRLNPQLANRDETIENLLAYLRAMSARKPAPQTEAMPSAP
jgi:mono/diheme cytochrome c family protein